MPRATLSIVLGALCFPPCSSCSSLPAQLPAAVFEADDEVELLRGQHAGPPVADGSAGPRRFVGPLFDAFDMARALELVRFIDGFYRAPGNDGYEAVLEHLAAQLRVAGFGSEQGFEVGFIGAPPGSRALEPAWTPLAGRIALVAADGSQRVLHAFSTPEARDRVMLPINAPACVLEGDIARSLDELGEGEVLVTDAPPSHTVLARAEKLGAIAVLSANIENYNVDPSGRLRHLDAIQFRTVAAGQKLPVGMLSRRSLQAIESAHDADGATRIRFEASVRFDERPLRTLCATIVGSDRAGEAVVTVSHVQEPGACDNASGIAGLCETACGLARAIRSGELPRPSRSLVFLWGDEMRQSSMWLDSTRLRPIAALSSDMTGESREKTGAIALLERMPDPGALEPFEPDVHTPWGRAQVDESKLAPNGVALIARCAMLDVATRDGDWTTAEHPYEGGSDHDVFIERGIPAALFWHFVDFAYHTSLDRLEHVDVTEMRRTGVALMATALALADPRPADLERYLRSLNEEQNLRVAAAEKGGAPQIAAKWHGWCTGARQWLRVECLRIPESESKGTK